jgi:hypothetical protein
LAAMSSVLTGLSRWRATLSRSGIIAAPASSPDVTPRG